MTQEKEMARCEVGNHDVAAGDILWCAVCRRGACFQHLGNPLDALAGDLAACPKHVKQVAELNRKNLELLRDRLKRPEGEW
jgi:hypothetical protein